MRIVPSQPSLPLGVTHRQAFQAILAGLFGAASFPPCSLYPLILVSAALFLYLLRDMEPRAAANLGIVYGLTFGLGTMYWFFVVFTFKALPLIFLMALYFALTSWIIAETKGMKPIWRAFWTALAMVGIEWLRGDAWYLRFPWYTLPHALAQEPHLIAPVRWIGTYGFSFMLWFIIAWGIFGRIWAWFGLPILACSLFLLPGFDPPNKQVILIQAEGEVAIGEVLRQVPAQKVDLIVMPEYSYYSAFRYAVTRADGPKSLAEKCQCPVVFGAVDGQYGTLNFFNVAVVIDAQGQLLGTFPKQHPVPMMLDGKPGDRRQIFPVTDGVLGVAVCYDFDAPEVVASLTRGGATVLVSPTFDALWWTEIEHVHHELLCRLRAVENDRWVLRSVSSGRSEVITPHGVPSAEGIPIAEKGFIVLPFAHRATFALGSYCHFLGPVCMAGSVLFLIYAYWKRKSRRYR